MFLIKIYIKESYINYYHTIIQMCGQYCILAPSRKNTDGWHSWHFCTSLNRNKLETIAK